MAPFSSLRVDARTRRRRRLRLAAGLALSGMLLASAPASVERVDIVLPTLPSLPTTTPTLPPLPTTIVTLPPLPTTTLTLPTLPTTIIPAPTATTTTTLLPTAGICVALGCDDGNPCTEDRCDPIAGCVHVPLTGAACDDGDPCTADDRCVAGLCAGARIGCTSPPPCPESCDDGFSCTDDVCTADGCLHVPVDSRCVPPGECTSAVCAPGLPGADANGCVVGTPRADGAPCAEDTDACTVDVCRDGACAHERPADTTGCAPVQGVFRQTIALRAITQDLRADVTAADLGSVDALVAHLTSIEASLAAAQQALAGDTPGPVALVVRPSVASSVPANLRARIAFTDVLKTPREVAAFLDEVDRAQQRAAIVRSVGRMLRRGGRRLLSGTKSLKADLRRLQRGAVTARSRRRHASLSGT